MPIFRLLAWTRFDEAPDRVWAARSDPERLDREFPPGFRLRLPRAEAETLGRILREGGSGAFEGRFGAARLRWPMRVEVVRPGRHFRDTSENALFRRWVHDHIVEETTDGARYLDRVTFEPATAWPRALALATERLFIVRHRRGVEGLRHDPQAWAVTALRELFDDEIDRAWDLPDLGR